MPAHHVLQSVTVWHALVVRLALAAHQDTMCLPVVVIYVLLLLLGVVHAQIVQPAQPAHLDTT
jgi:hypothetical protein